MPAKWLTPSEARTDWSDAPSDDRLLQLYLDAAQEKVAEYAPAALVADDVVTIKPRLLLAQRALVRDLWNALHANVSADTDIGYDSYAVSRFPMSLHVKDLIRPPSVRPSSLVG